MTGSMYLPSVTLIYKPCTSPVSLNSGGKKRHSGGSSLHTSPGRHCCPVTRSNCLGLLSLSPGLAWDLTQIQPLKRMLCRSPPSTPAHYTWGILSPTLSSDCTVWPPILLLCSCLAPQRKQRRWRHPATLLRRPAHRQPELGRAEQFTPCLHAGVWCKSSLLGEAGRQTAVGSGGCSAFLSLPSPY